MHETGPRFQITEVATILRNVGIDQHFLAKLVRFRAIAPERGGRGGKVTLWSREDIFKAFVCKVMLDAYYTKYPHSKSINGGDLKYVIKFLPGLKFNDRYKEFTCKDEWRKITEDAAVAGMGFEDTPYKYVAK